MQTNHEVCCAVLGFIHLDKRESDVINHRAFQRLRRIRQLAWTEHVFPGATHTRFEHSLGVLQMASLLFDSLVSRSNTLLRDRFGLADHALIRWRKVVRLAALMHDLGHGPFSHATEGLMPFNTKTGDFYKHEDYTLAAIERVFPEILEEFQEITAP